MRLSTGSLEKQSYVRRILHLYGCLCHRFEVEGGSKLQRAISISPKDTSELGYFRLLAKLIHIASQSFPCTARNKCLALASGILPRRSVSSNEKSHSSRWSRSVRRRKSNNTRSRSERWQLPASQSSFKVAAMCCTVNVFSGWTMSIINPISCADRSPDSASVKRATTELIGSSGESEISVSIGDEQVSLVILNSFSWPYSFWQQFPCFSKIVRYSQYFIAQLPLTPTWLHPYMTLSICFHDI